MVFECPSCAADVDVQPAGRPNVRSQVLEHLTQCTRAMPAAGQVDHLTELALRNVDAPPAQCVACVDVCTIHGEDDNIALCSDLG